MFVPIHLGVDRPTDRSLLSTSSFPDFLFRLLAELRRVSFHSLSPTLKKTKTVCPTYLPHHTIPPNTKHHPTNHPRPQNPSTKTPQNEPPPPPPPNRNHKPTIHQPPPPTPPPTAPTPRPQPRRLHNPQQLTLLHGIRHPRESEASAATGDATAAVEQWDT